MICSALNTALGLFDWQGGRFRSRLCENVNGSLKSASVREICNGLVIQLAQISRRSAESWSLSNQPDRVERFHTAWLESGRYRLPFKALRRSVVEFDLCTLSSRVNLRIALLLS